MEKRANPTAVEHGDVDSIARERDRLQAELVKHGDFCVESLWPEDVRSMEAGDGLTYGDVLSEDELLRTTWRAVKAYRYYVDAGDARNDFVAQAADSVVGAAELRERIDKGSRETRSPSSDDCRLG